MALAVLQAERHLLTCMCKLAHCLPKSTAITCCALSLLLLLLLLLLVLVLLLLLVARKSRQQLQLCN